MLSHNMATAGYYERERAFYTQRQSVEFVLSHADFVAPDHPYIEELGSMSQFATFGVIDTTNGLLHANGNVFRDSVIIAPVLDKDLKTGHVSIADTLLRRQNVDEQYDFSALDGEGSGNCDASELLISPIISLAPYMNNRHPLVVGTTVLHELDHAYWWLRRNTRFKGFDPSSERCIASQEISANRLEQQVMFAHLPETYDDEFGKVSLRYADHDFERPYAPRLLDKLKKSTRVIAFINFMFDVLGADVGVEPSSDVIRALKAQRLM